MSKLNVKLVKDTTLRIRIDKGEKMRIVNFAKDNGVSLSSFLTIIILKDIGKTELDLIKEELVNMGEL